MKLKLEALVGETGKLENELYSFIIGEASRGYSTHRPQNVRIENQTQYKEHFKRFPIIFSFEAGRIEINSCRIKPKGRFLGLFPKKAELGYRVSTYVSAEEKVVDEFIKFYDEVAGKNYKMKTL